MLNLSHFVLYNACVRCIRDTYHYVKHT